MDLCRQMTTKSASSPIAVFLHRNSTSSCLFCYCISHSLELFPHTWLTTAVFCRTLVVAHCSPIQMTCGSCSCREHIINLAIGVSRPLVRECGTTFHPDYGGGDSPSTPSDYLSVISAESLPTFQRKLKRHLFCQSFPGFCY